MKVIFTGNRMLRDEVIVVEEMKELKEAYYPDLEIILGGAPGLDTIADSVANVMGIDRVIYPANWNRYPRGAAGPIRNKKMLDRENPDKVVAFLHKNSKGTKNMVEQAQKRGIEVKIIPITDYHLGLPQ